MSGFHFTQLQPVSRNDVCLQKPHDQAIAQELIDAFDLRCWGLWLGDVGLGFRKEVKMIEVEQDFFCIGTMGGLGGLCLFVIV